MLEFMQLSIPQRVARGAAWLDARQADWHEQISVGRIDVSSSTNCILAQLGDGSFHQGLTRLDPTYTLRSLAANGFASYGEKDTRELNRAWATEVMRRQGGQRSLWARLRAWFARN